MNSYFRTNNFNYKAEIPLRQGPFWKKPAKKEAAVLAASKKAESAQVGFFLPDSHLDTQMEQAMSPVTFRQVRPMSNSRSTATISPM